MSIKRALLIIVGLGILAFAYYAISPLFRNIKANDALPTSTSTIGQTQDISTSAAEVTGTAGHPASGTARVVQTGGKTYLRYENFKTINGPDIYVYLAKDLGAKNFVSLGQVRATEGNINYEIPAGVNPSDYPYVLTWCKTFGVLFNSAKIN